MEHIKPLIIKFIYIAAITMIFLSYLLLPAVPPGSSLVVALVITLVLYFAGDRYMLSNFGALPTAIANLIMAAVILALAGSFVRQPVGAGAVLATAAVIGVAEWIYFRYLRSEIGAIAEGEEMTSGPEFFSRGKTPLESEKSRSDHSEEHEDGPEQ